MTDRPNVILIVLDTVRARQLGLYGRDRDPMPNLTEFAEDATVFDRAYTNAPWTVPAHASLFTGTLPSEHGCHGGSTSLSSENRTIAEEFSAAGYRTCALSNNVWISDHFGFDAGFDEFYKEWQLFRRTRDIGHLLKEDTGSKWKTILKAVKGNPLFNGLNGLYGKYLYRRQDFGARRTTKHMASLLDESQEPFFFFVNYMEGHAPFMEHESTSEFLADDVEDVSRYTKLSRSSLDYHVGDLEMSESDFEIIESLYEGELRYLDSWLGRVFDELSSRGMLSNSIVAIVGDHGENIGDHGLMAHRFSVHDTLLHVPMVVRHPDRSRGERIDSPVGLTDLNRWLGKTISESTDPASLATDGPVVSEYLSTEYTPESRREDFEFRGSRYDHRRAAVITDEHKLTTTDRGHTELYEFDGGPDFETEGHQLEDRAVESRLLEYCPEFEDGFESCTDNQDAVETHLRDLGYLE